VRHFSERSKNRASRWADWVAIDPTIGEAKMTESNQTPEPLQPTPETNEVEFERQVVKPTGQSLAMRAGIVAGAGLLVVVGAVAAMGASPSPSTVANPGASAAPGASDAPGNVKPNGNGPGRGGFERGGFGRFEFGGITISAISGSDVSLKTEDGWSRTITIASTTTLTKGSATITVADLAVGDQVRFQQTKGADGTYTVTKLVVVLPTVAGKVTAVDGSTITVTQRDGTTATIHVDGATTYNVNGAAGALSDIKVGSFVAAEGTKRTDGSLDAAAVRGGTGDRPGKGPGRHGDPNAPVAPDASPAPSSGAS
jgi:hypothetical protein